jgi:hypothetical protein
MTNRFVRKHSTRRKRLIAQALQADPYAELYQDTKPCSAGHEKPWRYLKGGACQVCMRERDRTKTGAGSAIAPQIE